MKLKSIQNWAFGVVAASAMSIAPVTARAEVIQLGFILDSSGSIGSGNWTTIVGGLSSAINTLIPIGGTDTYEISVVSFSSSAAAAVQHVLITDATVRSNVATTIAGLSFLAGSTNFAAAFSTMQSTLSASTNVTLGSASKSYVNFATDGVPNDDAAGQSARNAAIAAGVDNISIEGIGTGVNASSLQNNYCYPQPCDTTNPYSFPTTGFYIAVANANDYVTAIQNKIRVVTNQTPEPGSIALVGLALAGAGFARRYRKA